MSVDIRPYTRACVDDVIAFERELRRQEDFWGWSIDEAYVRQVTASFDAAAFDAAVSFLAYEDGRGVGRIDAASSRPVSTVPFRPIWTGCAC